MLDLSFDRRAARDGIVAILPLAAPGIPFGFVLGLLIEEEGLPRLAGWSSSWIIFAGSSQLAGLTLLADGAAGAFIVLSIFVINSRHFVYSAALRPVFSVYPLWFRILSPYLLIDQSFAIATTAPELDDSTPRYRMWHFLASGALMWSLWQLSVAGGIFLGDLVREEWMLSFAAPILFVGLTVFSVTNRPALVAAIVAAIVGVFTRDFPQGSGLIVAIVAGMTAGALAETRRPESTEAAI